MFASCGCRFNVVLNSWLEILWRWNKAELVWLNSAAQRLIGCGTETKGQQKLWRRRVGQSGLYKFARLVVWWMWNFNRPVEQKLQSHIMKITQRGKSMFIHQIRGKSKRKTTHLNPNISTPRLRFMFPSNRKIFSARRIIWNSSLGIEDVLEERLVTQRFRVQSTTQLSSCRSFQFFRERIFNETK